MSEKRTFITKEKALELIGNEEFVHVLLNSSSGILIGADWEMKEIKNLIESAKTLEIGGKACRSMGHGLVADYKGRFYFIKATLLNETEPAQ